MQAGIKPYLSCTVFGPFFPIFVVGFMGRKGKVFVANEDAKEWTMEQENGDIIFVHRETQARKRRQLPA